MADGRPFAPGAASEVYDLQSDPQEAHDLASSQPNVVTAMSTRIAAIRAAGGAQGARRFARGRATPAVARLRGFVARRPPDDAKAPNPAGKIADWNAFEDALSALNTDPRRALPALEALARRETGRAAVSNDVCARVEGGGTARSSRRHLPRRRAPLGDGSDRACTTSRSRHVRQRNARRHRRQRACARRRRAPSRRRSRWRRRARRRTTDSGLLAADADRPREAAAEFQRATEIDPNNASYWANLGTRAAPWAIAAAPSRRTAGARRRRPGGRWPPTGGGLLVEAQKPAEAVAWLERATGRGGRVSFEAPASISASRCSRRVPAGAAPSTVYRSVFSPPPAPPK
jgi:hypothetical protein